MNNIKKNRWYDVYPDFSEHIEKIKHLKKGVRDRIILGIKDLILDFDSDRNFRKSIVHFVKKVYNIFRFPGDPHVYSLTIGCHINGYSRAIVMEDFEAIPLDKHLLSRKQELTVFLQIARTVAEIIGDVHEHNIIYKGIQPQNILINPGRNRYRIWNINFPCGWA